MYKEGHKEMNIKAICIFMHIAIYIAINSTGAKLCKLTIKSHII